MGHKAAPPINSLSALLLAGEATTEAVQALSSLSRQARDCMEPYTQGNSLFKRGHSDWPKYHPTSVMLFHFIPNLSQSSWNTVENASVDGWARNNDLGTLAQADDIVC